MQKTVDIIVPCYNEEESVALLYANVNKTFSEMGKYRFCLIYVDDGSKDCTLQEIKKLTLAEEQGTVQYISFARNFGKESAMYAGLEKSTGDYVVLMDADLQHPPELLPKMLERIEEGHDVCATRRISRKGEPPIRSAFAKIFYHMINRLTAIRLYPGETDYRLMTRQVVDSIISLKEKERFTKGIYSWVGFDTEWIEYENVERVAGQTKWSFGGLFSYACSGFIAFATTPLRCVTFIGMLIVGFALAYGINVFVMALKHPDERTGYATLLLAVLFIGGVIITILGIISEYIARIYLEVKDRPIYIVKESNVKNDR